MELSHHRKKSHLSRYFYCLSPLHYYQSVWSTSQLTDLFMDPDSLLSHLYLTPRPLCCFNGGLFTVWRLLVCFCPSGLSGRDFLSLCPPRWRGVPLRWGRGGGGVWVHQSRFAIRSAAFHCHSLPRILAAYRLHQRGQMTQIHRE